MDVYCTTCTEPWDTFHLREEAIHETDFDEAEIAAWLTLPSEQKLAPRYRQKLAAVGWQFGSTMINVMHCPACPKDAAPDAETLAVKAALEELLAGDEDALATTFEDQRL